MWPTISDMSRDECRKCLRCLELDAYGNMVSVLRAQGPLTDDKRKLLAELAKILHISNERHRAEIRRAVNDEKLSIIAEQLNGPNTYTDWAIEGRRTIPLLPRLKAHTAFTGLANSLSLVLAAANEKKFSAPGKTEDPVVKEETEEGCERDESPLAKLPILRTEVKARGKKRKRSSPGSSDNEKCRKARSTETDTRDIAANSIRQTENRVESPSPLDEKESTNVVQVSIVTPSSNVRTTSNNNNNNTHENSTANAQNHRKFIVEASNHRNFDKIDFAPNTMDVEPTSIASEINGRASIVDRYEIEQISPFEKNESENEETIVDDSTEAKRETNISRPDSTTSGTTCHKRLINTKYCVTTKPIITSSTNRAMAVNSGSTASCGPGPPSDAPSATLTYKKTPTGKLDHRTAAKVGVALNSSKTWKINAQPNARLASKANVIVVQKGSSRGVTLSHGGKEVLGKVIMGGKNLCLASQKKNTSVALLPHRGDGSNSGESTLTTLNANRTESLKLGTKAGNVIMLDIRQDVIDENAVLSQYLDASGTLTADVTIADLENSVGLRESTTNDVSYGSAKSVVSRDEKSPDPTNGSESIEEDEASSEDRLNLLSIVGDADSSDAAENREILETIDEEIIETIDTRSEIFNYDSVDEIIIEDRTGESIETSNIEIFGAAFDQSPINIDNLQCIDEDREIVIESCENTLRNDEFGETVEEIDELGDS